MTASVLFQPTPALLTVYGHSFSRAHRCLWMLKELGIPYHYVLTGFQDGATRQPDYRVRSTLWTAMRTSLTVLWDSGALQRPPVSHSWPLESAHSLTGAPVAVIKAIVITFGSLGWVWVAAG